MTMASGTWGTIPWSISDDGTLTLGAGVQPYSAYATGDAYPWHDYKQSITSVQFTGNISKRKAIYGGDTEDATLWGSAFEGYPALASVSGLSYVSNATAVPFMFSGCSSLTSIDLSGFDTSKLTNISFLFADCPVLASVKFGAYGFGSLSLDSTNANLKLIDSNYKTAEYNGIIVSSDKQFLALEKSEQAGTWTRNATASTVSCTAQRTAGGTARDDGDDVTFSFTWAFAQGSTSAPARIYQKAAGDPSYPSTPTASLTLSGNAGNTTYTIAGIGDAAYDYRVEIVDGSSTYVFFPAVTANIRLMDFDEDGNAHVYGGLTADGDIYPQGAKMADFIVEQGTSGIWTYRKWHSGIAECWGIYTASMAINTASTSYGGYRSVEYTATAYPFEFAAKPVVSALMSDNSQGAWVNNAQNENATAFKFYLSSGGALAAANRSVSIHAIGRWK